MFWGKDEVFDRAAWIANMMGCTCGEEKLIRVVRGWSADYSLTETVAAIWSLAAATIHAVKHAATTLWNGIKAAGQFIMDTVVRAVLESMAFVIDKTMLGLAYVLEALLPQARVVNTNPLTLSLKEKQLVIDAWVQDAGLMLRMGSVVLSFANLLDGVVFQAKQETLMGIAGSQIALGFVLGSLLRSTQLSKAMTWLVFMVTAFMTTELLFLDKGNMSDKEHSKLIELLLDYHIAAVLTILVPFIKSIPSINKNILDNQESTVKNRKKTILPIDTWEELAWALTGGFIPQFRSSLYVLANRPNKAKEQLISGAISMLANAHILSFLAYPNAPSLPPSTIIAYYVSAFVTVLYHVMMVWVGGGV